MPTTPAALGVLPSVIQSPTQALSILQKEDLCILANISSQISLHSKRELTHEVRQQHGIELQAREATNSITNRVDKLYETLVQQQHHHLRLLLPLYVAAALQSFPFLIAPAVTAFYYRDFDDIHSLCIYMHDNLLTCSIYESMLQEKREPE